KLAAAAAVARSDLPLILLCPPIASRVRFGFEDEDVMAVCETFFVCEPPTWKAPTFDPLLGGFLIGETAEVSCLPLLTFRLVAGGCGKGRAPFGALTELVRFIGGLALLAKFFRFEACVG